MKFYIATRFSVEEFRKQAIDIKGRLEALGHEMTFDWMNGPDVKPYDINRERTADAAQHALQGALDADVFILIPEPSGTGMYVEFGAALTKSTLTSRPKIYLLGPHKNCMLFNFHPLTIWKETIEEIITEL